MKTSKSNKIAEARKNAEAQKAAKKETRLKKGVNVEAPTYSKKGKSPIGQAKKK